MEMRNFLEKDDNVEVENIYEIEDANVEGKNL